MEAEAFGGCNKSPHLMTIASKIQTQIILMKERSKAMLGRITHKF